MQYPCGWVSPFGHYRIKACCQLPDTFRRLPRPSSPLTAKASTVCAYSLDHITPSRLGVTRIPANGTTYHYFNKAARAARLSLYDTSWTFVSKRSLHPDCQRTCPSLNARASQSRCAQIIQSRAFARALPQPSSRTTVFWGKARRCDVGFSQ